MNEPQLLRQGIDIELVRFRKGSLCDRKHSSKRFLLSIGQCFQCERPCGYSVQERPSRERNEIGFHRSILLIMLPSRYGSQCYSQMLLNRSVRVAQNM